MNKWITAAEASLWLGVSTKHLNECARDGRIKRKPSGLTGATEPKFVLNADDCSKLFKSLGSQAETGSGIARIVIYKPWTAAGLRELRA